MATRREMKREKTFGDYQSFLKIGSSSFIGIGGTPAESRRLAIEAANLKTNSYIFSLMADRLNMITEPAEKAWSTKNGND